MAEELVGGEAFIAFVEQCIMIVIDVDSKYVEEVIGLTCERTEQRLSEKLGVL